MTTCGHSPSVCWAAPGRRGADALRWAQAGLRVVIGSRAAERAQATAAELRKQLDVPHISGQDNTTCASACDVAVVAVPWEGHGELLKSLAEHLADKIVIDCVNPLGFDQRGPHALVVPEGSAAQQAQTILANSRVTAAFHHVSATVLADLSLPRVEGDVLVLGDDRQAVDLVCALAGVIPGMRGIYGGRLRNAGQVEALTANLIAINKRYRTHASIKITGLPADQ